MKLDLRGLLLMSLAFSAQSTHAVLGEIPAAPLERNRHQSDCTSATVKENGFGETRTVCPHTTVIECSAPGGAVFAVRWTGHVHPDQQALLGSFYPEYAALNAGINHKGQRFVTVNTSKMHFTYGGLPLHVMGFAYAPDLVPANVNVGDCK